MFPRAPLPERIGTYRVLRRLPATGADLYLGREEGPLGFSRTVVLKLAPAVDEPELAEELAREAAVVARMNHPSIVRMFNFFQYEDRLVLVLERVEGTNLGRVLAAARRRRQPLPLEIVYHVAHRLLGAIAHAHGMMDENGVRTPVVHRAISPAAIQLGWDGALKLAGFGLAKVMGRSPDTAVGLVKGTPGYMAPEQLRGERVTERADVYQAGLIIWELCSGNPPATAGTPQKTKEAELVQMLSGERLASVSMLRPAIPREIAAVFDAALEPAVEKRSISAVEIERWLAKTVDTESGREMLRERAIALRGAVERGQTTEPARPTSLSVSVRRATQPRFPAGAVRATGRISALPPDVSPPSGRRVPAARRSSKPPPRLADGESPLPPSVRIKPMIIPRVDEPDVDVEPEESSEERRPSAPERMASRPSGRPPPPGRPSPAGRPPAPPPPRPVSAPDAPPALSAARRTAPELTEHATPGAPAIEEGDLPPLRPDEGRTRETLIVRRDGTRRLLLGVVAGVGVLSGALLVWKFHGSEEAGGDRPAASSQPSASASGSAPPASARTGEPAPDPTPGGGRGRSASPARDGDRSGDDPSEARGARERLPERRADRAGESGSAGPLRGEVHAGGIPGAGGRTDCLAIQGDHGKGRLRRLDGGGIAQGRRVSIVLDMGSLPGDMPRAHSVHDIVAIRSDLEPDNALVRAWCGPAPVAGSSGG
jgi:serine/threonine-protein kinase